MRSLGIDVGVRKGLDLVLLDEGLAPVATHRRLPVTALGRLIEEHRPDVIAVDSPPSWATSGRARRTEREVRWFGIQCFGTPTRDRGADHPFYEWMRVGFEVFRVAAANGYPRYGSGPPAGHALEVFPHATAVVLAGCLPPQGSNKRSWRGAVLRAAGVDGASLSSVDQVDAALAALTGLFALRRRFSAPGDPAEGVIVLPSATLPANPYRRCPAAPEEEVEQPPFAGMSPCRCGDPECAALTGAEFARGHDAKRKSGLWARARAGQEAVDELRRRGWELPPEMR
ncbi:MAG: DUF429 domain-containing protein [Actinobacteria bacterium]|nr:DUF429 domain-containing protein [Actinomycetota bacterium]